MDLSRPISRVLSEERIQLHELVCDFKIGTMHDKNGVIDGFYLEMFARTAGPERVSVSDCYFYSGVKYLQKLQRAAIEWERDEPGFMAKSGANTFRIIAKKLNSQKKYGAKKKVFSLRLDVDPQRKFTEKCNQNGQSQSEAVRVLMEGYIAKDTISSWAGADK